MKNLIKICALFTILAFTFIAKAQPQPPVVVYKYVYPKDTIKPPSPQRVYTSKYKPADSVKSQKGMDSLMLDLFTKVLSNSRPRQSTVNIPDVALVDVALVEEYHQNLVVIDSAIGSWDTILKQYRVRVKWSAQKVQKVRFLIRITNSYKSVNNDSDLKYEFNINGGNKKQNGEFTFFLNERPKDMMIKMGNEKMKFEYDLDIPTMPKCNAIFLLYKTSYDQGQPYNGGNYIHPIYGPYQGR